MKKINIIIALVLAISFFSACQSYKRVPYLQNSDTIRVMNQQRPLFDAKIMPKDLLTITVSCTNPELAMPFNLSVQSTASVTSTTLYSQPVLQQYLVDNNGNINFPVLGTLHLSDLTKREAEAMIIEKLKPYLKEIPIVNVRMSYFKVSVLGEVSHPGMFVISNEKVNVLEALADAGDLTIYGRRDNVKLIREDSNGKENIYTLNLNNADIVLSPYYYLQQNDILYVTPNKTKAKNSDIGTSTTLLVSATSILISIASLLVNILK